MNNAGYVWWNVILCVCYALAIIMDNYRLHSVVAFGTDKIKEVMLDLKSTFHRYPSK